MQLLFTDTHCHIHDPQFFPNGGDECYERALAAGVHRMLCVGTDAASSLAAVQFAQKYPQISAVVGIHPHEASDSSAELALIRELVAQPEVVGIGEIGLDYYYNHAPKAAQIELLHAQLELALEHQLPVSFHVRDAFEDFWPIFDQYRGIRGVLHSFTDSVRHMEQGLSRGLYVGVNGIATFARDRDEVTRTLPLESIVLETDAPFLTPAPKRGKINEPAFITLIAQYTADLRFISLEELSRATERNATKLFN